MHDSKNVIRQTLSLALVIISLLNTPAGSNSTRRPTRDQPAFHSTLPIAGEFSNSISAFSPADPNIQARVRDAYGKLPLRFEANEGQVDSEVRFVSRGTGYNLFLTSTEAVLQLGGADRGLQNKDNTPQSPGSNPKSVVRMKLTNANDSPTVEGMNAIAGKSNYFIGNDPSKWRRNVTSYGKVRYRSVYPGIDMVYYGNQRQLEYDFVIAPGADPKAIKLDFDGVEQASVDVSGDLVLRTASEELRQRKPFAYQEVDGYKQEVASRFLITGKRQVSFELDAYDHTRPLVIDPVLDYSTYLGGFSFEWGQDIAVDKDGCAYVAGPTVSYEFPIANPFQPTPGAPFPDSSAFVTKISPDGSTLVYSTYLGGNQFDTGYDLAVDRQGNAYVVGSTGSSNFPMKNPLQSVRAGDNDAFVAKLNPDGSALVFSTLLGGNETETGFRVALDRENNVYITGLTRSTDFPLKRPLQPAFAGLDDGFVAKINAAGSALIYSTYLGGSDYETPFNISADDAGNAYIVGDTRSADFPTAHAYQPAIAGQSDAFLTKINASGSAFIYSTYLGGSDSDGASDVALDRHGNVYLTGGTRSANFPTVAPMQPALAGSGDVFLTKFNRAGSALLISTYIGGTGNEGGGNLALNADGCIYITGSTSSLDFPTVDALQPIPDKPTLPFEFYDVFVTKLDATVSRIIFSTYLGGTYNDSGFGIALDADDNIYICGETVSPDFPITPKAFQRDFLGPLLAFGPAGDGFITKISAQCRHQADLISNDIEVGEEEGERRGCR